MKIEYSQLDVSDLQGETVADFLIAIEASLLVRDGTDVIYEEPYFPVAELARQLSVWLDEADGRDFVFNSLSFEEPGAVTVVQTAEGWVFGSRLTPDVVSAAHPWSTAEACVRGFVDEVRSDLHDRGIDPDLVVPSSGS